MRPPHKLFFSSLKQVEKRLKLDDQNPPPPPSAAGTPQPDSDQNPPPAPSPADQTQSTATGSPIYLHNTSSTLQVNDTEQQQQPPQEFLSDEFQSSPQFQFEDLGIRVSEISPVNDVESMMRLLGLSDFDGEGSEMNDFGDDEFYDKIVKVKGPKCKKEVERLNGWIKYLLNNGEKETLRLTHLLLAKASFVLGGNEFPSTVDEFLHNDPPLD